MNKNYQFFVTCPLNAGEVLEKEIVSLGGEVLKRTVSGITFNGNMKTLLATCLWSRIAGKVMLLIKEFEVEEQKDLYSSLSKIAWDEWFSVSKTLSITTTLNSPIFTHSGYTSQLVKDAVVDFFREKTGDRPNIDNTDPDVRLHLHLEEYKAQIYFDLSGDPLFKRGYRIQTVPAPLKETTAALVLLRSGWKKGIDKPFLDPFCGSGTLLIEAAMIAGDIAPGFYRTSFGFFSWLKLDEDLWSQLLDEAEERMIEGVKKLPSILGSDIDSAAVAAAEKNIKQIGLEPYIRCIKKDFLERSPMEKSGIMITNPPYGERLGSSESLTGLYSRMGETLIKSYPGWSISILNSNDELDRMIGLRRDSKNVLMNGKLRCELSHYSIHEKRLSEKNNQKEFDFELLSEGEQILYNRLKKRIKYFKKWAAKCSINCYRVYDKDLPEYSAAIDFYEDKWIHISEYVPPADFDPDKAEKRLQSMVKVILGLTGLEDDAVFLKQRKRQKGNSQYRKMDDKKEKYIIHESECAFYANFTDYLDTGIFLDHRLTRAMLGDMADGKSFLNLFCYTGTATAIAARGGASTTTSVDASNTYLSWAKDNMALNGFKGDNHRYYKSDCLEWLKRSHKKYDLIFIDPPTFSNSTDKNKYFDVQRDYINLIKLAGKSLESGGKIVFSNNFRRFKMEEGALSGFKITDISASTIPEDFKRNPRIHQCWMITR